MMLDDVLYGATERVSVAAASTARSAADLITDSPVQATGRTSKPGSDKVSNPKAPAISAAVLAFAALGVIVAMRRVFAGAIS